MKTTIDAAGRLVIPKEIRQKAGLQPGMSVEVTLHDGVVEIEPTTPPVRVERRGRRLVAVPLTDVPPLTNEIVNETLDALRRERGGIV